MGSLDSLCIVDGGANFCPECGVRQIDHDHRSEPEVVAPVAVPDHPDPPVLMILVALAVAALLLALAVGLAAVQGWRYYRNQQAVAASTLYYQVEYAERSNDGKRVREIAARLTEDCFDHLDGPILRIAAPDTPVPFSTPLEEYFLPNARDVVAAARKLAKY